MCPGNIEVDTNVPAIKVRNARKQFIGGTSVLNGLNMTVCEGSIYALLGPSGCGKTTLLRCILGRAKLDSGSISTKVTKLENIGYMPQETALLEDLTIYETFKFFGEIYQMKTLLQNRSTELLSLLNLDDKFKPIKDLSGGEKRRVSFAVALLHDPELLILDEPTVGVDPLLNHNMWEYLLRITEYFGKTIVITTHYIEEARQANIIALMRNGTLLAEKAPQALMTEQNADGLEQAFFNICQNQLLSAEEASSFNSKRKQSMVSILSFSTLKSEGSDHLESGSIWKCVRFKAQLEKNFIWVKRNPGIIFFLLMLPVVLAFLANIVFRTSPKNLKIGIVSDEFHHSVMTCDYSVQFKNCTKKDFNYPLSCFFVNQFTDDTLKLVPYKSIESARRAVKRGDLWGVVYFHEDYTKNLIERIFKHRLKSDQVVEHSSVIVWLDMTSPWVAGVIKYQLYKATFNFVRFVYEICTVDQKIKSLPMKSEDAVYGSNNAQFIHHALPGLLLSYCFYLPMMFTTSAVMMEKSTGILDRNFVAGLTFLEVIASHVVIQSVLVFVQTMIMMELSYSYYESPQLGSWTLICVLIALIESMGTAYGLFLSLVFDEERFATFAGIGTIVGLFAMLGVIWPFEGMHPILKSSYWFIPVLPATETYRAIAQKGWGLSRAVVCFGFLQTTVWILIFIAGVVFLIKYKKVVG